MQSSFHIHEKRKCKFEEHPSLAMKPGFCPYVTMKMKRALYLKQSRMNLQLKIDSTKYNDTKVSIATNMGPDPAVPAQTMDLKGNFV